MAFDIKKWLREDMKFSEAEAEEMGARFTPERLAALETGYASASDLTQARGQLKADQDALQAANMRLNEEMAEWASLTASEKEQGTALRQQVEQHQREVFELQQSLTRLATQYGVDPKTVVPAKKEAAPVSKTEPAVDVSQFVSREQFGPLMSFMADLPAQLQYIGDQHYDLTGTRLDPRPIVAEIKRRAAKDPQAVIDPERVWEEMHGIPKLREAKSTERREAELKQAEDRGYERARTEAAIPSPSLPGRKSIVFRSGEKADQPRTSVLKRPQPEVGVRTAAAAFATGKYRQTKSA